MHAIKNGNDDCWITHTNECHNVKGGEARLIRLKERHFPADLPEKFNPHCLHRTYPVFHRSFCQSDALPLNVNEYLTPTPGSFPPRNGHVIKECNLQVHIFGRSLPFLLQSPDTGQGTNGGLILTVFLYSIALPSLTAFLIHCSSS
jgi:hypothetical protein